MPAVASVSVFYTFSPKTRSKASQMNFNFNLFRGHIVPIDPNAQTAINNTYGLGTSEYAWTDSYVTKHFFGNTTTSWSCYDGATAVGDFIFDKSSTRIMTVADTDHTTAVITITAGGTATCATTTLTQIPGATVTLAMNNRPAFITLVNSTTTVAGYFELLEGIAGSGNNFSVALFRNSVQKNIVSFSGINVSLVNMPLSCVYFEDFDLTTGSNTYELFWVMTDKTNDAYNVVYPRMLVQRFR